jgi:hypothetical protein
MTTKTLRYFSGNIPLGLDPSPDGDWEHGTFVLGEDTQGFKTGDRFEVSPEDLRENDCLNDSTGEYELLQLNSIVQKLESILFLVQHDRGDREFRELDILGLGPADKNGRIFFLQEQIINQLKNQLKSSK